MTKDVSSDIDYELAPVLPPGPIVQSVTIAFRAIYAGTILLGLVWLFSNVRQISPDSQAVVQRFGRIVRNQSAGLLLALPRPFEDVRLLPGKDRQLSQQITALPESGGILSASSASEAEPIPPQAAPYLTGDGNIVLLDSTVIYRITDPRAYFLAEGHVAPVLNRLFRAAAVRVTAEWKLTDFIVAQTGGQTGGQSGAATALRGVVRDDLLKAVNNSLAELSANDIGIGVTIDRIDMTAWLPPEAKIAFDAVLTASQQADQEVAAARTDAERLRQGAQREGDRLLSAAEATAKERIVGATVNTSQITALDKQSPQSRAILLSQAARTGLGDVLRRAGTVSLIDPKSGVRLVLPGRLK
jgi:regulator of protease activity HflC (stomatin/prohibitin superfamily)